MLGPALHNGLCCMAWTVLAVGRWFLDIAGVLADWNRSDMHLAFGVVGVVRVCRSLKSGVPERRWPTQAQLMRSDNLRNIDVLGRECLWSLLPLSPRGEEGESAFLCLVSALVIRPVLMCSVLKRFVHATGCGKHLFVITIIVIIIIRVRRSFKSGVLEQRWPTRAQLTRSDNLRNIDVLCRGFL